jgi:site-specific DNA-methyltransferase (adenine-specific)
MLHLGDCLDRMKEIESGSVDAVICDPPYGTTACAWDSVIPLDLMWKQVLRVVKDCGAIVFTSSQPFTSALGASQISLLKYAWVWEKNRPTGHVHARNKPMKKHEDVLVFSTGTTVHAVQSARRMTYNPQGLKPLPEPKLRRMNKKGDNAVLSLRASHKDTMRHFDGYPSSIVHFDIENAQGAGRWHPTQKPVALMEYLIRTYTNEGETVLDFTMGSGTTGVAAVQTGRRFIGIERDESYFEVAQNRIQKALIEKNRHNRNRADHKLESDDSDEDSIL